MRVLVILASVVCALGQESINMHSGLTPHVGIQALIAVVMCFSILGACAISVNIITRTCAKRLSAP